jgi:hypothetical protein
MSNPAGWYRDESMESHDRYWDGQSWTDQTRESTMHGEPPPPSMSEDPQRQNQKSKSEGDSIFSMNAAEFEQYCTGLTDREATFIALKKVFEFESQVRVMALEVMSLHESGAGRKAIRPKLQALIALQKEHMVPALTELSNAMEEDFEELVREIGGTMFLPVSQEDAWNNFAAPVKRIFDEIQNPVHEVLGKVADIEDQYLFA